MRGWIYALCLLLVGVCWSCNDYDLGGDDDTSNGGPGGLDDDDDDDDDDNAHDDDADPDDDDTGVADDDDNGDDDDTTQEPPPELLDECPDKVNFSFVDDDGDGYVAVLSWDPQDSAVIHVDFTGIFHIYDTYIAESGASQINEIGYLTISNSHNPAGVPEFANCESYWIVPDTDNHGTPPAGSLYVGTFPLVAGEDNVLTLNHYCELYRAGLCQSFQNGTPGADGSCDDDGPNSIHMALDSICLVPL